MASTSLLPQLNRLYGSKLLHCLLDIADSSERLGEEEDPNHQDLIFENIPKGDPNKRIRWGTDKDIDRKQITLRLSVYLGFAKGFLPTIEDGANLVRALKFPLHYGEETNTPLVKKFATMINQVVDPIKLGPSFVVEEVDKRQGLKRLMVTEELALCIEDRSFHHSALGSIALPTNSAKQVHRNDLRLHIHRSVLGVDVWVAKVMEELRRHGHLQLGDVPHQFYVDEDVSDSDGEYVEEDSDRQLGSAEDSDNENMTSLRARHSFRAAPVYQSTAAPRIRARRHREWAENSDDEDVTSLRCRSSNGTAPLCHGTAAPRLSARQHHEWLQELQQMQEIVLYAQDTNVPAQHLLAARGFEDSQVFLAHLRRLRVGDRRVGR